MNILVWSLRKCRTGSRTYRFVRFLNRKYNKLVSLVGHYKDKMKYGWNYGEVADENVEV